jgi:hypothetical protein
MRYEPRFTYRSLRSAIDEEGTMEKLVSVIKDSPEFIPLEKITDALNENSIVEMNGTGEAYFDNFKRENDSLLFAIKKERSIILVGQKATAVDVLFTKDKNFIMKHTDENMSKLCGVLNRVHHEAYFNVPENVINKDYENRLAKAQHKANELFTSLGPIPDEFWSALEFIANASPNYEAFHEQLFNVSMFDLSDRNFTRLSRATIALGNENKLSDSTVTAYRALPDGYSIETGDWVTTDKQYADDHLENTLDGKGCVASIEVSGDTLYETSSVNEQVFVPRGTWNDCESLKDVWDLYNHIKKPDGFEIKKRSVVEIQEGVTESKATYLAPSNLAM